LPHLSTGIEDISPSHPADAIGCVMCHAQFVSCEWVLDCVDCHTSAEAMGGGHIYGTKKDAAYRQCKTCHGTLTEPPAKT